jgi:hypothetical protein
MITIQTVLVLGAGASNDFKFPTGWGLKSEIIRNLRSNPNIQQIADLAGCEASAVHEFRDAFNKSGKMSVDAFLEHRSNLIEIGKIAIAQALIPYEKTEWLFQNESITWYEYLYNKMNSTFEEFDRNKLTVITFNYDRSFENFMFTALKNTYGRGDEETANKIKSIPVIHVHGKLGYLPWEREPGAQYIREYHDEVIPAEIKAAAQNIKIVHDSIRFEDDNDFKNAYEYISTSNRIIFLGFGYDPTNLSRLRIDFKKLDKEYLGSCYGLGKEEIRNLAKSIFNNIDLGESEDKILSFLRKKDILTQPLKNDIKKALITKVHILALHKTLMDVNLDVSMYLRILESLTLEESAVLNGYVQSLGGGALGFPLTSTESIELGQEKLTEWKILRKEQAFSYKLTEFGNKLCGFIKGYDHL